MSTAHDIVRSMCEAYAKAVNSSDSEAYGRLFTEDAIRIPPGSEPEHGSEDIRRGEQALYDQAQLTIRSDPTDVIRIGDDWIFALAAVKGDAVAQADGSRATFRATKAWLLHRQPSGEWRLARHMWNMRP